MKSFKLLSVLCGTLIFTNCLVAQDFKEDERYIVDDGQLFGTPVNECDSYGYGYNSYVANGHLFETFLNGSTKREVETSTEDRNNDYNIRLGDYIFNWSESKHTTTTQETVLSLTPECSDQTIYWNLIFSGSGTGRITNEQIVSCNKIPTAPNFLKIEQRNAYYSSIATYVDGEGADTFTSDRFAYLEEVRLYLSENRKEVYVSVWKQDFHRTQEEGEDKVTQVHGKEVFYRVDRMHAGCTVTVPGSLDLVLQSSPIVGCFEWENEGGFPRIPCELDTL